MHQRALISSLLREEPSDFAAGLDGEVLGLAKHPHEAVPDSLDEAHPPDHQLRAGRATRGVVSRTWSR